MSQTDSLHVYHIYSIKRRPRPRIYSIKRRPRIITASWCDQCFDHGWNLWVNQTEILSNETVLISRKHIEEM